MSADVLVELGTKGALAICTAAHDALEKAIGEHGASAVVAFPETNYYLPLANAFLKIEAKTLADCRLIIEEAKKLDSHKAASNGLHILALGGVLNKGIATLLCEEVLAAIAYLSKTHPHQGCAGFLTDTLLRALGIQLVDGRIAGIAVILGPAKDEDAAVQLARDLQSKSVVSL